MFAAEPADQTSGSSIGAGAAQARLGAASPAQVSDHEAILLALLLRCQPATAYQLLRIHAQSPLSRYNESKGSLYPLVRRLTARGLLASCRVAGDRRNARLLTCTDAGRDAVRTWACRVGPMQARADDPLAVKAVALDLLSASEQRAWIGAARQLLIGRMAELEMDRPPSTLTDLARTGAMLNLRSRIEWLELLSRCLGVNQVANAS